MEGATSRKLMVNWNDKDCSDPTVSNTCSFSNIAMASNLVAMASNLIAMASTLLACCEVDLHLLALTQFAH